MKEREAIEELLEDQVMKGERQCGLYDTCGMYVSVYLGGEDMDDVCFKWLKKDEKILNSIPQLYHCRECWFSRVNHLNRELGYFCRLKNGRIPRNTKQCRDAILGTAEGLMWS